MQDLNIYFLVKNYGDFVEVLICDCANSLWPVGESTYPVPVAMAAINDKVFSLQ